MHILFSILDRSGPLSKGEDEKSELIVALALRAAEKIWKEGIDLLRGGMRE